MPFFLDRSATSMYSQNSVYDMSTHVFSPQGGLLQIEYAHAATNKGSTAIGIKTESSVVFVTERSRKSSLLESCSMEKVQLVEDHALCVYSGIVSDANILVEKARTEALNHRFTYDETIGIRSLVQTVGALANTYADPDLDRGERSYARPFGVSMLFAGVDAGVDDDKVDDEEHKVADAAKALRKSKATQDDPGTGAMKLFLLTPAGSEDAVDAVAIGAGAEVAKKDLLIGYKKDLTTKEAIVLCLQVLKNVSAEALSEENVEMAKIERRRKPRIFTPAEIKKFLVDAKISKDSSSAAPSR